MAMPLPQFHPTPRALNVRSNPFNNAPLSWVAKSFGAFGGSQENRSRTNGFVAVAKSVARSIRKDKNQVMVMLFQLCPGSSDPSKLYLVETLQDTVPIATSKLRRSTRVFGS